jgi:tetratricopeptide (TPR) repeat protein
MWAEPLFSLFRKRARLQAIGRAGVVVSSQEARSAAASDADQVPDGDALARARSLRQAGRLAEALAAFDELLVIAEGPADVHQEIALTHLAAKDLLAAIDSLQVAVALDPTCGEAWSLLGSTLSRLDREPEAIDALRTALTCLEADRRSEARLHLANSLLSTKRYEESRNEVTAAIEDYPGDWRFRALMANLLLVTEEEEAALRAYEAAVERCAAPSEGLLLQLASSRQRVGQFHEAQKAYEAVLERNPGHSVARWYQAQCDLVLGRWERGWQNYSARFAAGASPFRALPFPVWDGSADPKVTLLVLADQGLGDEIMFASCFQDAIARVGHCIVECEPRLQALFARSFPEVTVVSSQRESDASWLRGLPKPDFQIFAGDLPALFRRDEESFGAGVPYLQADPTRVEYWRAKLKDVVRDGFKIGFSWRGGVPGTRSRSRSIRPEDWAPLFSVPGLEFVNLQYGDTTQELEAFDALYGSRIAHFPEAIADYDETAALVCALDMVVTVCTSIVHLSGALGRPVWILVPCSPGFRYTIDREALPWYASSRMFRQSVATDWRSPLEQLTSRLREVTKGVT